MEKRLQLAQKADDSRTDFFGAYYRTIWITFLVILVAAVSLSALQFSRSYDHEVSLIKRQFQTNNADLELIIEACVEHVNGMRVRAKDYFSYSEMEYSQPIFQYLSDDESGGFYHLDRMPYTGEGYAGNLTGKGKLADLSEQKMEEINMALTLNHLFKVTAHNIPNVAWVYYTSEDFINIYPFVPSKDFRFTEELYYHDFYQHAIPANNPRRELFWTTAYIDEAGKGMMVTCAEPIYDGEIFKGSVAVDLTFDSLNRIVSHSQREHGQLFIVNPSEQILAHPTLVSAQDTAVHTLTEVFPAEVYRAAGDLSRWPTDTMNRIEGYYMYYENIPHTPWQMVYLVSIWEIYWKIFSNIGLALLFLLGAIASVLIIANRTIQNLFIDPAHQLIDHIQSENQNLPIPKRPAVPDAWFEWFVIISRIFQANRDLVGNLEKKVEERTKEITEKNEALQASQEEIRITNEHLQAANFAISDTNKKITDSINYARRIQRGTLPAKEQLRELFPESFCYYAPRDIVSGDFYWYDAKDNFKAIAVADCTGHGVPGAFMSMLGITILEDIVMDRGITSPETVLDELRLRIMGIFQNKGQNKDMPKDGMNISLCMVDEVRQKLYFSGAYQAIYIIRGQQENAVCVNGKALEIAMEGERHHLYQVKADKQPIGHFLEYNPFTLKEIDILPSDTVYLFSDGYVDQFGGEQGRKFMSRRFKRLLISIQDKTLADQGLCLKQTIRDWMGGGHEQIDDICVIGFKP